MNAPARHRPKHRLGQNFLRDRSVLEKIIAAAEITEADQIVEIGPGRGVMTEALAEKATSVVAVELDRTLAHFLDPLTVKYPHLKVIYGDFMKTPWESLGLDPTRPIKVVANIPYYITTPILLKLLQADRLAKEPMSAVVPLAERILLMIQWEVALRLAADPGKKDYGSLTLCTRYAADFELVTKVPAAAFKPQPDVDSAVVMLKPRTAPPVELVDAATLFWIVRGSFQQRRKTLRNGLLAAGVPREIMEASAAEVGIDLGRRAETLSLAEFAKLADAVFARQPGPSPEVAVDAGLS